MPEVGARSIAKRKKVAVCGHRNADPWPQKECGLLCQCSSRPYSLKGLESEKRKKSKLEEYRCRGRNGFFYNGPWCCSQPTPCSRHKHQTGSRSALTAGCTIAPIATATGSWIFLLPATKAAA